MAIKGFSYAAAIVALTGASCADLSDDCDHMLTCVEYGDGDMGGSDGDGDETGGSGGGAGGPCDVCEAPMAACNAEQECVECTADDSSACGDDTVCDPESETCVQCLTENDCDASAPVCDGNECGGCEDHTDCEHLSATPLCEADSRACVQCLPLEDDRESDTDACGTNVCDPQTFACDTARTQAIKGNCTACIADAECTADRNCIPLRYTGGAEPVELGGFCIKLADTGCSPPYQAGAINRASLSGLSAANYCGLAEAFTTCAAIKDLEDGKECAVGSVCGTANGEGLCETVNFGVDTQCTYSCTASAECPSTFPCNGPDDEKYCGGPM